MRLSAEYHSSAADPAQLREVVETTTRRVKAWLAASDVKISHIVATGISGQSVVWPLSLALDLPVCIVRKHGETSHMFGGPIVGTGDLRDYIIVDDLISTGDTMHYVIRRINEEYDKTLGLFGGPGVLRPRPRAIFLTQRMKDEEFHTQKKWLEGDKPKSLDFGTIPAIGTRSSTSAWRPLLTSQETLNDTTV
jgi:hypothetical protein